MQQVGSTLLPRLGRMWHVCHLIAAGALGWGAVMALLWIGRALQNAPQSVWGLALLGMAAFSATAVHLSNPYKMPPHARKVAESGTPPTWRQAILALLAPAAALGSGLSVMGAEVPSTVASGGLAAKLGRREEEVRLLLAAGAASAFAALFGAPLAGLAFGLEFFRREMQGKRHRLLPALLVAVCTCWCLMHWVYAPQYHFPHAGIEADGSTLITAMLLALAVAGMGWLYCQSITRAKALAAYLSKRVTPLMSALAATGIVALATLLVPVGSNRIDLLPPFGWWLLAVVAIKLVLVAVSAGFGLPGGTFGPALALGAGVAALMGFEGEWLLIGAASLIGPIAGVPLASGLLVAEATHDPIVILHAAVAILIAEWVRRSVTRAELYPR